MAKGDYNEKRSSFAERLKTSPTPATIQQVQPIAPEPVKVEEVQINAWIPKALMKRVKTHAVEHEQSLKDIVTTALEQYLAAQLED